MVLDIIISIVKLSGWIIKTLGLKPSQPAPQTCQNVNCRVFVTCQSRDFVVNLWDCVCWNEVNYLFLQVFQLMLGVNLRYVYNLHLQDLKGRQTAKSNSNYVKNKRTAMPSQKVS